MLDLALYLLALCAGVLPDVALLGASTMNIWPCGLHQSEGKPPEVCPICNRVLLDIRNDELSARERTTINHQIAWTRRKKKSKEVAA